MLKGVSGRVWRSLKKLIGEALGARTTYPTDSLPISEKEAGPLCDHAKTKGVQHSDE